MKAGSAFAAFGVLAGFAACVASCRSTPSTLPPPHEAAEVPAPKATPPPEESFLPKLRILLDDPRLAAAQTAVRGKDWATAAAAVRAARPADLTPDDACAWDYLEGRLLFAASDALSAQAAFAKATRAECPLTAYARLRSAQAYARAGHADDAIAEALQVPPSIASIDEANLVLAESYAQKNDLASALPLWRAWLKKNPYGPRWVDTSVRIATALLDGVDGPAEKNAREAFDLATKVVVEAPRLSSDVGAEAVRARAATLLRAADPKFDPSLTGDERAKQAQAWLDDSDPTKAFLAASTVVASAKDKGTRCRAAITRAKASAKAKLPQAPKTDPWADAIASCEGDELLPNALYAGAKARGGKEPKTAIDWYDRLERTFPTHRLADDARLRGALLVGQSADDDREERADRMLATLADAYPSGDMGSEALFRAALGRMERGNWAEAVPLLDRIVAATPDDRHWATAGRAAYFRALAAGKADAVDDEKARLAAIVDRYPLAYYMVLAYARLAALDAPLAARTVQEAEAREAEGPFPSRAHEVLASAPAVLAMRLLEVGDVDAARREFAASGALADGVDPEVVWVIGALYNRAGAPEFGHAYARSRLTDYLAHYPKGRWRFPWEVAFPRAFEPLVAQACAENGLPRSLAWGIMREESSFLADVKSPANAFGLMQLIVPTAKWVSVGTPFGSDEASLKRPEVSIGLGTRLLAKLRAKHGHPALAIGAYNAGSGAVDRWMKARGGDDLDLFVELIPYDETRNYVKRVLASQAAYAYLYDPPSLAESFGLPFRLSP